MTDSSPLGEAPRLRQLLDELEKFTFPIQNGPRIPWSVIALHDRQAQRNHGGQTLLRLSERGGLSPSEAVAVLEDREWQPMNHEAAKKRLNELVAVGAARRDLERVTRFEVIDATGRAYTLHNCTVKLSYQDDNRTLKVFVEPRINA